jgi:hypothetical protein
MLLPAPACLFKGVSSKNQGITPFTLGKIYGFQCWCSQTASN